MKKTFAALTLAATLAFGSTFTFAGIIITDKVQADTKDTCTTPTTNDAGPGIIIFSAAPGIIIFSAIPGIIIFSSEGPCTQKSGILISD